MLIKLSVLTKTISANLILAAVVAVAGTTKPVPLPSSERSLILDASRLRSVGSYRDIPTEVLRLCFPGQKPADPDKPWNPTDAVQDPSLPFSRICWMVTDNEHWLIAWEHGGVGHTTGFMLISRLGNESPKITWDAGAAGKTLKNFAEFRDYVRTDGVFARVSSVRP
jgi:hypothetical protein